MSDTKATTPPFRASYPSLFTARLNKLSKKEEFSVVALFKKGEDLSGLKAACQAAAVAKWGTDKAKWPKKIRWPFRDQAEKVVIDKETGDPKKDKDGNVILQPGHEAGAVFLNLRTSQRPGIVNQKREPVIEPSEIYAGQWLRATVNAYAYDQAGNSGVNLGLNNIQIVKDGEPLAGRAKAEDDFEQVTDSGTPASSMSVDDMMS